MLEREMELLRAHFPAVEWPLVELEQEPRGGEFGCLIGSRLEADEKEPLVAVIAIGDTAEGAVRSCVDAWQKRLELAVTRIAEVNQERVAIARHLAACGFDLIAAEAVIQQLHEVLAEAQQEIVAWSTEVDEAEIIPEGLAKTRSVLARIGDQLSRQPSSVQLRAVCEECATEACDIFAKEGVTAAEAARAAVQRRFTDPPAEPA